MQLDALFNDKDFASLMFPVHKHKEDVNLIGKFPTLASLDSFRKFRHPSLDVNKVIRYIVYCYDRESPILKKFMTDEKKRKQTAALYAKFSHDDNGLFDSDTDDMMKCRLQEVNLMIIDFVRLYNDPEWSTLMMGYESYYQKLEQLVQANVDSKRDKFQLEETKGKLYKQCIDMSKSLGELAQKILTDENRYLERDFFCTIDSDIKNRLNITPERLAGIQ